MSMRDRIETKLKAEFSPQELVITDMSAQHSGHAGARPEGESHFHVKLVSASFLGKPSVSRQRMVYAALAQELEEGVHALSLTTLAPGEKS